MLFLHVQSFASHYSKGDDVILNLEIRSLFRLKVLGILLNPSYLLIVRMVNKA